MLEGNNPEVFVKIQEEARKHLKGDNLKNVLNLLAYLNKSGRTWVLSEYHPEFFYMDEMTCLFAFTKTELDEETVNNLRQMIEGAGNRFVYDSSSSWNLCFWQNEDDIYEVENFPIDEDTKDYARENVWKCIGCHTGDGGCPTPGGARRVVFGKEFGNACCNVFQIANPDEKEVEHIKILMELQKHIIANRRKV